MTSTTMTREIEAAYEKAQSGAELSQAEHDLLIDSLTMLRGWFNGRNTVEGVIVYRYNFNGEEGPEFAKLEQLRWNRECYAACSACGSASDLTCVGCKYALPLEI